AALRARARGGTRSARSASGDGARARGPVPEQLRRQGEPRSFHALQRHAPAHDAEHGQRLTPVRRRPVRYEYFEWDPQAWKRMFGFEQLRKLFHYLVTA